MKDEKLLTITEVADYLGIPKATLYAWRSREVGPEGIRLGKHVRYRRASVEAFLDARTDPSRDAGAR